MVEQQNTPKSDVIVIAGYAELQIDIIVKQLLHFFDDHKHIASAASPHVLAASYAETKLHLIISAAPEYQYPETTFNVLIGEALGEKSPDPLFASRYDFFVDLKIYKTLDEIVRDIIVGWSCWYDGRKITRPI